VSRTGLSIEVLSKAVIDHDHTAIVKLTTFAQRVGIRPAREYLASRKAEIEAYCESRRKKEQGIYDECMKELEPFVRKFEEVAALSSKKASDGFVRENIAYAAAMFYFSVNEDVLEPRLKRLGRLYGKPENAGAAKELEPLQKLDSRIRDLADRAW